MSNQYSKAVEQVLNEAKIPSSESVPQLKSPELIDIGVVTGEEVGSTISASLREIRYGLKYTGNILKSWRKNRLSPLNNTGIAPRLVNQLAENAKLENGLSIIKNLDLTDSERQAMNSVKDAIEAKIKTYHEKNPTLDTLVSFRSAFLWATLSVFLELLGTGNESLDELLEFGNLGVMILGSRALPFFGSSRMIVDRYLEEKANPGDQGLKATKPNLITLGLGLAHKAAYDKQATDGVRDSTGNITFKEDGSISEPTDYKYMLRGVDKFGITVPEEKIVALAGCIFYIKYIFGERLVDWIF